MRSYLITLLKFVISFSILAYLANQAIADEQFSAFASSPKNVWLLASGFSFSILAIVVGIYRWKCLVNALGLPFGFFDALKIGFIGQFFNLIAFGTLGADALRAFYLSKKFRGKKSEAIVTVIADRFTGLLTMIYLAAVSFVVLQRFQLFEIEPRYQAAMNQTGQVIALLAVGFTVLMGVFVFVPRLEKQAWFRRITKLPYLGSIVFRLLAILSLYQRRPVVLLTSFLLSLIVNLCFMLAIYFIAQGISSESPTLISHSFIEPIVMVCNAIPLPGGLGGMEFAMSILYRALGSPHGIVVAFTYRLSLLLMAAIGGVLWFLNRKQMDRTGDALDQPVGIGLPS